MYCKLTCKENQGHLLLLWLALFFAMTTDIWPRVWCNSKRCGASNYYNCAGLCYGIPEDNSLVASWASSSFYCMHSELCRTNTHVLWTQWRPWQKSLLHFCVCCSLASQPYFSYKRTEKTEENGNAKGYFPVFLRIFRSLDVCRTLCPLPHALIRYSESVGVCARQRNRFCMHICSTSYEYL